MIKKLQEFFGSIRAKLDKSKYWNTHENAYQHVHMFWSMVFGYALYKATGAEWGLFAGAFIGALIEYYQHAEMNLLEYEDAAVDSFKDYCFWWIGVGLLFLLRKYPL